MWLFHGENCAVGLFVAYYYSSNCIEASSQNNLVFCQKSSDLSSQLTTGSKPRLFRWNNKKETATCSPARYLEYKPFLMFVWVKCGHLQYFTLEAQQHTEGMSMVNLHRDELRRAGDLVAIATARMFAWEEDHGRDLGRSGQCAANLAPVMITI